MHVAGRAMGTSEMRRARKTLKPRLRNGRDEARAEAGGVLKSGVQSGFLRHPVSRDHTGKLPIVWDGPQGFLA